MSVCAGETAVSATIASTGDRGSVDHAARPVLSTLRTPSSTSSRSSWYSVPFPITPISGLIFGSVVAEEGCEKQNDREAGVEDVVEGVGKLTVV